MYHIYCLLISLIICTLSFGQSNQKRVLIEQFTSTTCPTCGSRNPEFAETILEGYPNEVIHVAYHNGIPLDFDPFYQANPTGPDERDYYYDIDASPQLVMNGDKQNPNNPMLPVSWLTPQLDLTSPIGIEVNQVETANARTANINITSFEYLPDADYTLRVIVAEKHIIFCTYFEYLFDNVFRTFLQNASTTDLTLPALNESANFSLDFELDEDWQAEQIFVIAFVQNNDTKEVINVNQSEYFSKAKYERACVEDTLHLFATIQPILCGNTNDAFIELDMCIDTAPLEDPLEDDYSYSWSNGENTKDIYNLSAGVYTVDITQHRTNTIHNYLFVVEGNNIESVEANISISPETNLSSNGSITVNAQGGTGDLSILWSNGATTFQLNNLSAGIYNATITDENGCTSTINAEVESSIDELVIIENSVDHVSCNGADNGAIDISVSGGIVPYDIDWSNGEDTEDISDLAPGNYEVIVTDAEGMTTNLNFVITEPTVIVISETIAPEFDGNMDGSISIDITGGVGNYEILWSNAETTSNIENLVAGNYSVQVSDENNCTVLETYTINMVQEGGVTVVTQNISCNGLTDGEVSFTPFGDITVNSYIWFGNGTTGVNLIGLAAGEYDFVAVDANNDVVYEGTFNILEPEPINVILNTSNGFEIGYIEVANTTGGTAPYSYAWTNNEIGPIINNLEPGTYSINITDVNGCMHEAMATIYENIIQVNNVSCNGKEDGSVNIIINDGQNYTFDWSNGETSNNVINLIPGPISVGIIDSNNDVIPYIWTITEPTILVLNSVVEDDTGNGGGVITNVSGGVTPYEWLWSDGSTETSINGNGGDDFSLTVTDGNECIVTENYTIQNLVGYNEAAFAVVTLFPNPADKFLYLNSTNQITALKVVSISGQLFYNEPIKSAEHIIDVSDFPNGIYFVELKSKNEFSTFKLIVAR